MSAVGIGVGRENTVAKEDLFLFKSVPSSRAQVKSFPNGLVGPGRTPGTR